LLKNAGSIAPKQSFISCGTIIENNNVADNNSASQPTQAINHHRISYTSPHGLKYIFVIQQGLTFACRNWAKAIFMSLGSGIPQPRPIEAKLWATMRHRQVSSELPVPWLFSRLFMLSPFTIVHFWRFHLNDRIDHFFVFPFPANQNRRFQCF